MIEAVTEPLWLAIEGKILDLSDSDLSAGNQERTTQRLAEELGVSRNAGGMLQLRAQIGERVAAGKPFLKAFHDATGALTLDNLGNPLQTAIAIATDLGTIWPAAKGFDRRAAILRIIQQTRLDLQVAKAKTLADDGGIRYLIEQEVASQTILETMGIDQGKLDEVHAAIEAEKAAVARVEQLLEAVEGQADVARAEHLINNDVDERLILEVAGIEQSVIDEAQKLMEAAIAEKKRLAEEEAARKKAEAEGPSLESIEPDDMVEHIEAIQEIMEFSEDPDEIRTMCEQSNIPRCLVDIAVTDADRLEKLLEQAEG